MINHIIWRWYKDYYLLVIRWNVQNLILKKNYDFKLSKIKVFKRVLI